MKKSSIYFAYFFTFFASFQLFASALELAEWEKSVEDKCLTIADVENMKPGEKIRVLVMDRNLWDTVCDASYNARMLQNQRKSFLQATRLTIPIEMTSKGPSSGCGTTKIL
jgi:hypothetical protein